MITRLAKACSRAVGKRSVYFWRRCAHSARRLCSWVHFMQFDAEYAIPPMPEAFDPFMNQHWQWSATGESYWVERGVFNRLAMKPGARVLELCCGLGHYTRHFYAVQASHVVAVDFEEASIERAKRYNGSASIEYRVADILTEMPAGPFDNVVWDAAIEHFTPEQIQAILQEIHARLAPGGILSGYTIAEEQATTGSRFHEAFFEGTQPLARLLAEGFANVKVFETSSPSRRNLYFYCSDATLPFDPEWPQQTRILSGARPSLAGRSAS